jgi:hypothetical protein
MADKIRAFEQQFDGGEKTSWHNEDSESRANAKVGPQEVTRSSKWTNILSVSKN